MKCHKNDCQFNSITKLVKYIVGIQVLFCSSLNFNQSLKHHDFREHSVFGKVDLRNMIILCI